MEINPGRIVKIIRNGERFWLRNVRHLDGKLYGQVDNMLLVAPYTKGQIIEIEENEIIEEEQLPPEPIA